MGDERKAVTEAQQIRALVGALRNSAKNLPDLVSRWGEVDADLQAHYIDEWLLMLGSAAHRLEQQAEYLEKLCPHGYRYHAECPECLP